MEIASDLPATVEVERQVAEYHPTVWGDFFITNPAIPQTELASLKLQQDELREEVRRMFNGSTDALQLLELIDRIQRLGVAYHFEKEINDELNSIHNAGFGSNDLYAVALHFRIMRQHRYHISCNVFEKFLNEESEFMPSFRENVKALLSLYEAAHLCIPGEEILDKAKKFTKGLLVDISLSKLEPHLEMMVTSALDVPLIRRVDRLRTKLYLSIYENETAFNKVLLNFAKVDFIILQALYQDEVRSLTMWWKDLDFAKNLPFARDRIAESCFWVIGLYHEPCYSRARMMVTKMFIFISLTDDIYDSYGTFEELKLFTDIIKSWELGNVSKLPNYMQHCFLTIYQTLKEFEEELAHENYSFRIKYLIEEYKKMVQGYLEEAKWANESYVPKLKEHLSVSLVTAGNPYVTCASYIGMKETITDEFFQWVCNTPPIMTACNLIGRLMNDIVSYEFEQSRMHVASTVQCYMMEHKCSKEEACKELTEMIDEGWKMLNKGFIFSKDNPMALIRIIVNMTNFNEFVYKDNDDYTNPNLKMKDHINAILVERVQIEM